MPVSACGNFCSMSCRSAGRVMNLMAAAELTMPEAGNWALRVADWIDLVPKRIMALPWNARVEGV